MTQQLAVTLALGLAYTCIGFGVIVLLLAICTGVNQSLPRWRRAKSWSKILRKEGTKPLLLVLGISIGLFVGLVALRF